MNRWIVFLIAGVFLIYQKGMATVPLGNPGLGATYVYAQRGAIPKSVVKTLDVAYGPVEKKEGTARQWFRLRGTKANGDLFTVWILTSQYPPVELAVAQKTVTRYLLQVGETSPLEFRDAFTHKAVLPVLGAWQYLFPRADEGDFSEGHFPTKIRYLGHSYRLDRQNESENIVPATGIEALDLLPDALIGVPHNTRQKDETRRYDDSDYELIRLTTNDYLEMIDAGMTCFHVDAEQAEWIKRRDVFYWGIGGKDVQYPECLYRSNYLGPTLYLDEPTVCTRDLIVRPRLRKDPAAWKAVTPQSVFEDFQKYFHERKYKGRGPALLRGLAARPDVDIGDMNFLQQNLYTWDTMTASAIYQLSEGKSSPPSAIVFEPPRNFGTMRTLPEMDMAYGCQIPLDDLKNLIEVIYGFARGAAHATGKSWGTSIYGAVDRSDAFWFLTHAYDLGARFFFFWDSHKRACVPYSECLALTRNLRAHIESHPDRDLQKLSRAAEVAITLPPGYNLGHVHMGRGLLWGLPELNLERKNRKGVPYRTVMANFFTEIERCVRLGVSYDLFWDIDGLVLSDYREIVRIRENGIVEVQANGEIVLHDGPRIPARPGGLSPRLNVELSVGEEQLPAKVKAKANVVEGSAPIYYTVGTDKDGIYRNVWVCWELFGPKEEDYRFLLWNNPWQPEVRSHNRKAEVALDFKIRQPGKYRLRAATVDRAGRTAVVWKEFRIKK